LASDLRRPSDPSGNILFQAGLDMPFALPLLLAGLYLIVKYNPCNFHACGGSDYKYDAFSNPEPLHVDGQQLIAATREKPL